MARCAGLSGNDGIAVVKIGREEIRHRVAIDTVVRCGGVWTRAHDGRIGLAQRVRHGAIVTGDAGCRRHGWIGMAEYGWRPGIRVVAGGTIR